jgi:rhodanese-related sulfurtransferase
MIMKISKIVLLSALFLMVVYLFTLNGQNSGENSITVEQVLKKVAADTTVLFLDVRTEPEFTGTLGHLPGAILVPLADLGSRLPELEKYRARQIIVVCASGQRSGLATKKLRAEGFNALNMAGGMFAWKRMLETMNKDTSGVKHEETVH